jgi:predicted GNAT family acetyltransferase
MVDRLPLREANIDDIPALVQHRRWMFEDMALVENHRLDPADLDQMDKKYADDLQQHLIDGRLRAWVIEGDDRIVASGSIWFLDWLPRPDDFTGRLPYLHSVYTVPEYRGVGLARRIVVAMLDECRAQGLKRVSLHASPAGQSIYETLGFKPTNEMRLVFE